MASEMKRAAGTGGSVVVDRCQVCGSTDLESVLFLGYLPPVNQMRTIGQRPFEQPAYPAELLRCTKCVSTGWLFFRRSNASCGSNPLAIAIPHAVEVERDIPA